MKENEWGNLTTNYWNILKDNNSYHSEEPVPE